LLWSAPYQPRRYVVKVIIIMSEDYKNFYNFVKGLLAAKQLLSRAQKKGCFIESVCLSASIIDASLRIGIILKHQLNTKSDLLLNELLLQSDNDKIISEREIYNRSLSEKIITQSTFSKLELLYKERNKVIHRYIISKITTEQVLSIIFDYELVMCEIREALDLLEKQQIKERIGMTVHSNDLTKSDLNKYSKSIIKMINEKHGNNHLAEQLKRTT